MHAENRNPVAGQLAPREIARKIAVAKRSIVRENNSPRGIHVAMDRPRAAKRL